MGVSVVIKQKKSEPSFYFGASAQCFRYNLGTNYVHFEQRIDFAVFIF
ncbi:protein of unknown function [Vibrio tapetis subsp. tapetis]|uniref:Uncharacterized protein n=1 Tax=Vibrio tapetis subsp. tapetis TaxID=1671868 RepID=A0A2N8ZAH8_9VIBR|nr:protein of unknown function [Vibrio tapetis subsp. tapetis]